jgi:hypothetical protein
MGPHTGVTKLKNLQMFKLRFHGVLFHPPNAVFQMYSFHGPEAASIKSTSTLVVASEEEITRRIVNVNYALRKAGNAFPNFILHISNTQAFSSFLLNVMWKKTKN